MKLLLIAFILFSNILLADSLNSLLKEYETTSDNSLETVNEKLGHVIIYSQKEIRLMQYTKLNDILKELPLMSLGKNRFGLSVPLFTGSKTVSGVFRFFINDHEISSAYTQSPALTWGNLPLDFIDHIEVYYGESSFALGNETGIYFIKIYTKSSKKENGNEIRAAFNSNSSKAQSFTTSQSFENGWSYLFYINNENSKDKNEYKNNRLKNNQDRKYLYLDISNDTTNINMGYTDVKKDNYTGLSLDALPDSGTMKSQDYYIDFTKYLLDDKSIKTNFSIDVNDEEYQESNAEGILLAPVLFSSGPLREFNEDLKFIKTNAYIAKTFIYNDNNILTALNIKNKKYSVKDRKTISLSNIRTDVNQYNNFDEETVYSLLFQDDYKVNDKFTLIANAKIDKYVRDSYLEDSIETLFRIGFIYTPFKSFGIKSFYTDTYLPPSFYNSDFADTSKENIKSQKYKLYTAEAIYAKGKSKFRIVYNNVKINDFIYLTPVGFINVDHTIKTQGLMFNYEYAFSDKNQIHLNYFTSKQSDRTSNTQRGGYVKYTGSYNKLDYFASLIYKKSFDYYEVQYIKDSFDLSIGATYNLTKNFSVSVKGENLLDKSTYSLYADGFPGTNFALKNSTDRSVYFSIKWVF